MKNVCITYHMAKADEIAETCITVALEDSIAKDLLKNQEDSVYALAPKSHTRFSLPALLSQLAFAQGYNNASFCCAKERR